MKKNATFAVSKLNANETFKRDAKVHNFSNEKRQKNTNGNRTGHWGLPGHHEQGAEEEPVLRRTIFGKNSAEKCLQEILRQTAPWNLYSRLENPEIEKTILNCYYSLIQDAYNLETFDDEAILMYKEVGSIEVCYYADGWEGWEEPSEFVSRFKRVKDKLLQDANMRTQFYNFLREGCKTQRKDASTSREALLRYYERLQGSRLYSFYDYEALYQACRQYYARKKEKMTRWKQKEGYCLPKTKGEWYDQVITHYRYYKHADTQQRQQLQEKFERYLAQ